MSGHEAGFVAGVFVTVRCDGKTLGAMLAWMARRPFCLAVPGAGGWMDGAHSTWGGFLLPGDAKRLREWLEGQGVSCGSSEPLAVLGRSAP